MILAVIMNVNTVTFIIQFHQRIVFRYLFHVAMCYFEAKKKCMYVYMKGIKIKHNAIRLQSRNARNKHRQQMIISYSLYTRYQKLQKGRLLIIQAQVYHVSPSRLFCGLKSSFFLGQEMGSTCACFLTNPVPRNK